MIASLLPKNKTEKILKSSARASTVEATINQPSKQNRHYKDDYKLHKAIFED